MTTTPPTDFVNLWKRSQPPDAEERSSATKTSVSERLGSSRSSLWTNLSQMSPSDQTVVMAKLTGLWPYPNERRALNWPLHAGLYTNCITSGLIATKINADMIMFKPKMSFLESVRQCPKSPFVFGVYSSGIAFYVLQQTMVMPEIYREVDPCPSCVLSRSILIGIGTGVLVPMIATPYLCYYVLLQRDGAKFPTVKNSLDVVLLSIEGSRAARPLLFKLIPLQVAVTAAATYSVLWGRNRIFASMDADPEFAKELLISAQTKPTIKEKVMKFLRTLPVISDVMGVTAPEDEQA